MTDCPNAEIRDLLPGYTHDRLSPAERATVEAHLATCDECSAELALIRTAGRALARGPAVDVERIAAVVRASRGGVGLTEGRSVASRASRRTLRWRQAAAVAAVAVGAISLAIAGSRNGSPTSSESPPSARVPVATRGSEKSTAPLAGTAPPGVVAKVDSPGIAPRVPNAGELTMAGGVGDLSDAALLALLDDIDSLDEAVSTEPADLLPALTDEEEIDIR